MKGTSSIPVGPLQAVKKKIAGVSFPAIRNLKRTKRNGPNWKKSWQDLTKPSRKSFISNAVTVLERKGNFPQIDISIEGQRLGSQFRFMPLI